MTLQFDNLETVVIAICVLLLGAYLTKKVGFLKKYNIPIPVTAGIVVSIFLSLMFLLVDIDVDFSSELGDTLLLAFYATIGLSARLRLLIEGGRLVLILLACAVVFLCIQNTIGLVGAYMAGLDPLIGLLSGSITLSGGHGTGLAYAAMFDEQFALPHAVEIALACATFGLISAGLLGGPLANLLIKRNHLEPQREEDKTAKSVSQLSTGSGSGVNYPNILGTIVMIGLCIAIGKYANQHLREWGLSFPDFVPCLFVGIIIINVMGLFKSNPVNPKPLALCSNISLDIFLTIALMRLELWSLFDLALPLFSILITQVIIALLFVYFIIFRIMGKNYSASVISGGYLGFSLGATPTAIANMSTITRTFGPSPKAFLVIPIVGAFFIDIVNATVIQIFLLFPQFN